VGPRAVLDAVVKRRIPSPRRESNPRTPIVQPVAQRCTDCAIMALISISESFNDNNKYDIRTQRVEKCNPLKYKYFPDAFISV
jgi:hypothetical protein